MTVTAKAYAVKLGSKKLKAFVHLKIHAIKTPALSPRIPLPLGPIYHNDRQSTCHRTGEVWIWCVATGTIPGRGVHVLFRDHTCGIWESGEWDRNRRQIFTFAGAELTSQILTERFTLYFRQLKHSSTSSQQAHPILALRMKKSCIQQKRIYQHLFVS